MKSHWTEEWHEPNSPVRVVGPHGHLNYARSTKVEIRRNEECDMDDFYCDNDWFGFTRSGYNPRDWRNSKQTKEEWESLNKGSVGSCIASLRDRAIKAEARVKELEAQLDIQPQSPKQGELIEVIDNGWDWEDAYTGEFLCFEGEKVWIKIGSNWTADRFDHWRPIQPAKESVEELQRLGRLV